MSHAFAIYFRRFLTSKSATSSFLLIPLPSRLIEWETEQLILLVAAAVASLPACFSHGTVLSGTAAQYCIANFLASCVQYRAVVNNRQMFGIRCSLEHMAGVRIVMDCSVQYSIVPLKWIA